MKNKNQNKNISIVLTVILFALYFVLYAMIVVINKSPAGTMFNVCGANIILSSCNGILISLQLLIVIIYSTMRLRIPRIFSIALPLFSILSTSAFIISKRNAEGVPGIVMMLVGLVAVAIILSQIKRREKDAFTDYLTGMHNRRSIMKHLDRMVCAGRPFGLLYIDIDEFKFLNDNYGHETGDLVIRTVSERINSLLDSKCVFGRIGGDEFVVITSGVNSINTITSEIVSAINQEITLENLNTTISVTASIGVAKFPQDAKTSAELTKCSDIAMYNIKSKGKNGVLHFNNKFAEEIHRKTSIENLAKKYLAEKSFSFEYQPQYCSKTKKLRGFETLIRIREEDRKSVSIQELIAVAEKTDIIYQIDEYVLMNALAEFLPVVSKHRELLLSVNASARHFSQRGFVPLVRKALEETGFPPECLEIEITEYCLAGSVNTTIANMNELKDMGIKIALDDFGTGFASLSYLSKLPVNLLKIDKSFTDELSNETGNTKDFISAIISMGHILGCEVISEGVESQNQLDTLREKNCDFIQGFLWGAPINIKMASKLCDKELEEQK